MKDKKYGFLGRYCGLINIPVYIIFPEMKVTEDENSDYDVSAEGAPKVMGRNWFYDNLLTTILFIDINFSNLKSWFYYLMNKEYEPKGFKLKLDELIEIEED